MKKHGRSALVLAMLAMVVLSTSACGPEASAAIGRLGVQFVGGVLAIGIGIIAILIGIGSGGQ